MGDKNTPNLFDGRACACCLVLSRLICGKPAKGADKDSQHQERLRRHAAALRIWILARAQRALAVALLRESAAQDLVMVHLKRTMRRFLELSWGQQLQWQHLVNHTKARSIFLSSVASFISPLSAGDTEAVEAED